MKMLKTISSLVIFLLFTGCIFSDNETENESELKMGKYYLKNKDCSHDYIILNSDSTYEHVVFSKDVNYRKKGTWKIDKDDKKIRLIDYHTLYSINCVFLGTIGNTNMRYKHVNNSLKRGDEIEYIHYSIYNR